MADSLYLLMPLHTGNFRNAAALKGLLIFPDEDNTRRAARRSYQRSAVVVKQELTPKATKEHKANNSGFS
jgi:hypothetical protein